MIDLRSDTCSQPTDAMRQAMATAPVGDDVYSDDPTVKRLEREVAEFLGKEDAVYMVTGTMTNQVAIRAYTEPGDAVLFDQNAHVYILEGGAPAAFSGVLPRLLPGVRGVFTPGDIEAALGVPHRFFPSTIAAPVKLLCVENTHNIGGGKVWPMEQLKAVCETARRRGLALHLDGARLWHASVATGIPESTYAALFDSVSICFSKAMGAPVGSILAGPRDFISRARRFKQQIGGGFRQAGIIAAGALYALHNNRERLAEDHYHAKLLAEGIAVLPGISLDVQSVETNIVRFSVTSLPATDFADRLYERGLHVLPSGSDGIRAIPYLNITEADVRKAVSIIESVASEHADKAGTYGTQGVVQSTKNSAGY
ncbi:MULTISPECIES: threonine aldolase family protein [Cupriavidus]|uniref:Threonine aldolase n=2 Tax=Cupriavidus TaxID=106589 RepID=A0A7W4VGR7_9BURK|nr:MULTISPECIES: GntG family PLP-dependent aldolase [Cupriavidus]MBB3011285.1 threonine aldolase [Cupriavidus alkaliphilus]QBY56294.1 aminotransferase class I/II-fold pyridoxal phosphate-dependent enzyme [Cupriavidus oxalaticus]